MFKSIFLSFAFTAVFLFTPAVGRAGVEYCRVLEVSGKVEILEAGAATWAPLSVSRLLRGGDKIRTSAQSFVEFSTADDFSGLLRIGANSRLEVLGDDVTRVFLKQGILMALLEDEENISRSRLKREMFFEIFTKDMSVRFLRAGCSVSVSEKGTWVRVFGEHVKAGPFEIKKDKTPPQAISEGFKYFLDSSRKIGPLGPDRMRYQDYMDWQGWVKKCYERKDAVAEAALIKR